VFCQRHRYQKLFDDDGRWLVQRCLCRRACCAYALGHVLIRIPLNFYLMLFTWLYQLSQTGVASSVKFDKSAWKYCVWRVCGIGAGISSKLTDTRYWRYLREYPMPVSVSACLYVELWWWTNVSILIITTAYLICALCIAVASLWWRSTCNVTLFLIYSYFCNSYCVVHECWLLYRDSC